MVATLVFPALNFGTPQDRRSIIVWDIAINIWIKTPASGACRKKYESITSHHDLAPNRTGSSCRITLKRSYMQQVCYHTPPGLFTLLLSRLIHLSRIKDSQASMLKQMPRHTGAGWPKNWANIIICPTYSRTDQSTPEYPRAGAKAFRKLIMTWPRFERGCPADGISDRRKCSRCVILHHQVVFFLFSSHTLCLNYTHPASNNSTQWKCTCHT
jgi:hypothetical protein